MFTALSPTANTMFSMAVWRGTVAGPLHWRAGWQTGSLARPIALNAYFCQENCPLVNYPNETVSAGAVGRISATPNSRMGYNENNSSHHFRRWDESVFS